MAKNKRFTKNILTLLLVILIISTTFFSCTKKSDCADAKGEYHTGYFTYFDEKITINGINGRTADVNGIFIYDELYNEPYPACTAGVSKKTIPLDFRNNGEEIHVAISGVLQRKYFDGYCTFELGVYDLDCIEKID